MGVPHKAAGEAEVESENADDAKDKKSIADVESLEEECDFCVYDDIRDKLIAKGIPAEEIAYINQWITKEKLMDSAARYGKSPYGEHLKAVAEGRVKY